MVTNDIIYTPDEERAYNKGRQDVASKIFEEIAEILKKHDKRNGIIGNDYGDLLITDISCDIGELKKKYRGE